MVLKTFCLIEIPVFSMLNEARKIAKSLTVMCMSLLELEQLFLKTWQPLVVLYRFIASPVIIFRE